MRRSGGMVTMTVGLLIAQSGNLVDSLTRPVEDKASVMDTPRCGYFGHPAFLRHDTGPGHPERADRLVAIEEALKRDGLWQRLLHVSPKPATVEVLRLVHTAEYVERARREILAGRSELSTGDTAVSLDTWEAATLAVGAVCDAVDAVIDGTLRNAFCAVRPPGHHARPSGGMGFCVFNNVAIGVRHALRRPKIRRVLIVDWDVHHGNGTQDAFWEEPAVLQFHIHQRGIYPGTGLESEQGGGAAIGRVMNYPLPRGSGGREIINLLNEKLAPAAREFRPDLVVVSAGYDAHREDPLGGLALTRDDFARMSRFVLDLAEELCDGRVVFVLEGGYNLRALGESVAATIREMLAVSSRAPSK